MITKTILSHGVCMYSILSCIRYICIYHILHITYNIWLFHVAVSKPLYTEHMLYICIIHYMLCIVYCILCIMLYSTYMHWAYVCTYVLYTICHVLCIVSYALCYVVHLFIIFSTLFLSFGRKTYTCILKIDPLLYGVSEVRFHRSTHLFVPFDASIP